MKSKIERKTRIMPLVGIFSGFFLLALVTAYFYSPVKKSFADNKTSNYTFSVDVLPALSLSAVDDVSFSFNNTTSGEFQSKPASIVVTANMPMGYNLYFSTIDKGTSLVNPKSPTQIVSDFTNGITSANMPDNNWGVSADNETFDKIMGLDNAVVVKAMDVASFESEWTQNLYFGVKVGASLPRGSYTKRVVFTVVASTDTFDFEGEAEEEPEQPALVSHQNRLVEAVNMQDPNLAQYCEDTYTPTSAATYATLDAAFYNDLIPRAVLTDVRDGNKYLISKLPDGGCWMSQNLGLRLSNFEPLTNSTTDLNTKASWTPDHETQLTAMNTNTWPTDETARSFKPERDIYYVGGTTFAYKPTSYSDDYLWEKSGASYNWYAASAGTTFVLDYDNESIVEDSICPKGWKMPSYYDFMGMVGSVGTTDRAHQVPFNEIMQHQTGTISNLETTTPSNSGLWSSKAGTVLRIFMNTTDGIKTLSHSLYTGEVYNTSYASQRGYAIRCKLR